MKKRIGISLAGFAFFCVVSASQATTITFEDLTGESPLPTNYQGLTWTNWTYYDYDQPPYNPSSGVVRIYNTDATTAPTVLFGQAVTFGGAWLAGYAADQYFEGYFQGVKIFESAHTANDFTEFGEFFTLNWAGVDEIRVQSGSGDYYILDDLTYSGSNRVPESGTSVVLFGLALLGLTTVRRLASQKIAAI